MMSATSESLVSSIKHTYVTMLLVTVAFAYFSAKATEETQYQAYFATLEPLLALRSILVDSGSSSTEAMFSDLPEFSATAHEEFSALNDKAIGLLDGDDNAAVEAAIAERDKGFPAQPIGKARLYKSAVVRFSARKSCDIMLWSGDPNANFQVLSAVYYGFVKDVPGSEVSFAQFEIGCEGPPNAERFTALVFRTEPNQFLIGIPSSFVGRLFGSSIDLISSFSEIPASDLDHFLPAELRKYIDAAGSYRAMDLRAVEIGILNILGVPNHRNYALSEFDAAVERMYDTSTSSADFLGVRFDREAFLRIVPFALLVFSFYLWRLLRQLQRQSSMSDKAWTPLDTTDLLGTVVAYVWAFGPVLMTSIVYLMYARAFSVALVVGGREISPMGLLSLSFPQAIGPGWYGWDGQATIALGLFALQVVLCLVITMHALRLVWHNLKLPRDHWTFWFARRISRGIPRR